MNAGWCSTSIVARVSPPSASHSKERAASIRRCSTTSSTSRTSRSSCSPIPLQVTTLLERYYREQGYLTTEIEEPVYEFEGTVARVVLAVREGPRFFVRNVSTSGNAVLPASALLQDLPVASGDPFLPFAAENALERIRDLYWQRGYNDVRSDYELALDREAGRVDVMFSVIEGPQAIIEDIVVAGNEKTSERLVREQVELEPGQPLDVSKLAQSRRNLYDTGAFSVVDIIRDELPQDGDSGRTARSSECVGTRGPADTAAVRRVV